MLPKRIIVLSLFAALAFVPAGVLHAQWVPANGAGGGAVYSFAVSGTILFAGNDAGVILSTDNGINWTAASTGLTSSATVRALAVSGTNLFAGTNGGGVFLTTDNGASWKAVNTGLPQYSGVLALAVIGTNLFAGTGLDVFRSTDSGASWRKASPGLLHFGEVTSLLVVSGTTLVAGFSGDGVAFSTNYGTSWSWANTGLTGRRFVRSLGISGTTLFAGTDDGVFRMTGNWTRANNGVANNTVRAFAATGTNLFAGAEGGGVFLSTDIGNNWGNNWTGVSTGLTNTIVYSLAVSGTNLLAGTDRTGVWHRPLSEMIGPAGVAEPSAIKPALRTYPNPFSQSTTISFTPETSGYADVSIVNLLGVEVARLFSGELAAGEHSFTWDAVATGDGCATGVYECLIRMNGRVEKLPVMLLR